MCNDCLDFSDEKLEDVLGRIGQGQTGLDDMDWMTEYITHLRGMVCSCKKQETQYFIVSDKNCSFVNFKGLDENEKKKHL